MRHRRSLLGLACAAALPGCVVVEARPGPPAAPAPPPPEIGSLAAYATVQAVEPAMRLVRLGTAGGGVFDMTFPDGRNLARLRPGMTVIAEYDAAGRPLIATSLGAAREAAPGRIRGMLAEVLDGGAFLVLVGPDRVPRTVAVPSQTMMAFATRLGTGAEVAVTLLSF
ncbi:hypothetical protein [Falsiroseomonas sp. HW251]|uniref:hypothetical protein n=1 Tax=Falsiroseomonas sp. HW251 TaxID=3390998 RepID=UPI003D3195E7